MRTPSSFKAPWWKGSRGEWYVAGQGVLLLLVALGPRTLPGLPAWTGLYSQMAFILGAIFLPAGGILVVGGIRALGPNRTPLPYPKETGFLVETGPYRIVRHPIYSGLLFASFGSGLLVRGWLTIGFAVLLFVLLDIKSRREEQWLLDKFPGYAAYRKKVRKFIPFIY
jgi:protein-S-isoprenylcysteine O-methyltransferase Ste14